MSSASNSPLLSIVTVVYNNRKCIEDAIQSVKSQKYSNIEHIVIDGNSNDGTKEYLQSLGDTIKLVSEPDKGIFDAMNKGLKLCTGTYIGLLNSDDVYASNMALSDVVATFEANHVDAVYGDLVYVDPIHTEKINRYWKSGNYDVRKFKWGWMPPHPTFFLRKSCYDQHGYFDLSLSKVSADYEIMLRMLYKYKHKAAYLPQILVRMRSGGNSNSSLLKRFKGNMEDRMAWKNNQLTPNPLTLTLKPLRKIGQFFLRPPS